MEKIDESSSEKRGKEHLYEWHATVLGWEVVEKIDESSFPEKRGQNFDRKKIKIISVTIESPRREIFAAVSRKIKIS